MDISPLGTEGDFLCADLSADGDRWEAAISMIGEDSLPDVLELINRNFPIAPGAVQFWSLLPLGDFLIPFGIFY